MTAGHRHAHPLEFTWTALNGNETKVINPIVLARETVLSTAQAEAVSSDPSTHARTCTGTHICNPMLEDRGRQTHGPHRQLHLDARAEEKAGPVCP